MSGQKDPNEPFAPSWQDDPDMLDLINTLEIGTHTIVVTPMSEQAARERAYPDAVHTCVEWRDKLFVICKV